MTNRSRMTRMPGQKEEPIVRFRRVVIFALLLLSCSSAMWYYFTRKTHTEGHYFVMDAWETEFFFNRPTIFSKGEAKGMEPWELKRWIKVGDSVSKAPCDDWLYLYRRDSITGEYKLYKKLGITYVTFPKSWFCE